MVAFCEYVPSKAIWGGDADVTLPSVCTKLVFARKLTVSIVNKNNKQDQPQHIQCEGLEPKAKGVLLV